MARAPLMLQVPGKVPEGPKSIASSTSRRAAQRRSAISLKWRESHVTQVMECDVIGWFWNDTNCLNLYGWYIWYKYIALLISKYLYINGHMPPDHWGFLSFGILTTSTSTADLNRRCRTQAKWVGPRAQVFDESSPFRSAMSRTGAIRWAMKAPGAGRSGPGFTADRRSQNSWVASMVSLALSWFEIFENTCLCIRICSLSVVLGGVGLQSLQPSITIESVFLVHSRSL